ncbi:hypothetical protein BM86_11775 [Bacillus thuringiensis]|uniref:Uncharacterized protein n=1 Tax=Bacillus thuringiensis TaxID=1428 RepID=A0A9W3WZZ9_BACTU|nr:hypothetical protein [Bacillus thuringiensis]ANS47597.1 hypothetical protein BT246_22230 [Bacillus thuringiensis]MBH0336153.1 hypothetical protein [Bacillus thuringiensis]
MTEISNVVSQTKSQLAKISGIEARYNSAVSSANALPYQDMKTDKLAEARAQYEGEKQALTDSIKQGVHADLETLKNKLARSFTQPMDSNAVDTLQLWLNADKVSEPEIKALAEQYQGEPLALRIIGQIAKKHDYDFSSFTLPSKNLESYLTEIDDFENLVYMIVGQYMSGLGLSDEKGFLEYRQSVLAGLDRNAKTLEESLSQAMK